MIPAILFDLVDRTAPIVITEMTPEVRELCRAMREMREYVAQQEKERLDRANDPSNTLPNEP